MQHRMLIVCAIAACTSKTSAPGTGAMSADAQTKLASVVEWIGVQPREELVRKFIGAIGDEALSGDPMCDRALTGYGMASPADRGRTASEAWKACHFTCPTAAVFGASAPTPDAQRAQIAADCDARGPDPLAGAHIDPIDYLMLRNVVERLLAGLDAAHNTDVAAKLRANVVTPLAR